MPYAEVQKVIQILEQNWSPAVRGHTMAMVRPSAYSVALRLQRVPRALQGRVRVSRALHGREGRLTRLAPAPRALGGRATIARPTGPLLGYWGAWCLRKIIDR